MSLSKSTLLKVSLSIAIAIAVASQSARAADVIVATIDQAKLVKIPVGTTTLIIGNPMIADVTQLMPNLMVLTPKAFGETNFMALDKDGNTIAGSMIEVVNGTSAVVVQRGMERQSYSCAPRCQPTERLGDDAKYQSEVAAMADAHFKRVSGTTAPVAPALTPPGRSAGSRLPEPPSPLLDGAMLPTAR